MFNAFAIFVEFVRSALAPSNFENHVSAKRFLVSVTDAQVVSMEVESNPPENCLAPNWCRFRLDLVKWAFQYLRFSFACMKCELIARESAPRDSEMSSLQLDGNF